MCEHHELLGEHHFVADDAAQAEQVRAKHFEQVADLVRCKTGCEVAMVQHSGDLVGFRVLNERAFGRMPTWCKPGRLIDRQDPSKLGAKFETKLRPDGLLDCKASIYALASAA